MSIKYYLLNLILLSFVCFARCQNDTSTVLASSTASGWTTSVTPTVISTGGSITTFISTTGQTSASSLTTGQISTASSTTVQTSISSSITGYTSTSNSATGPTSTPNSAAGQMSTSNSVTGQTSTSNSATGQTSTSNSVTGQTSMSNSVTGQTSTANSANGQTSTSNATYGSAGTLGSTVVTSSTISNSSSTGYLTTLLTLTTANATSASSGSVGPTSSVAVTSATSAATSAPIMTINATYQYSIQSTVPLQTGVTNNITITNNLLNFVNQSFNLTNFNYNFSILQIDIELAARTTTLLYNLFVGLLFTISTNCNIACINQRTLVPATQIILPAANGTLVDVFCNSTPILVPQPTTTTVIYPVGAQSPGIPAQLGMGIGISLIGVLLIAEIIFLYWKFGLSNSPRREEYAMTG